MHQENEAVGSDLQRTQFSKDGTLCQYIHYIVAQPISFLRAHSMQIIRFHVVNFILELGHRILDHVILMG